MILLTDDSGTAFVLSQDRRLIFARVGEIEFNQISDCMYVGLVTRTSDTLHYGLFSTPFSGGSSAISPKDRREGAPAGRCRPANRKPDAPGPTPASVA